MVTNDYRVPSPCCLRLSESDCQGLLRDDRDPILAPAGRSYESDDNLVELRSLYRSQRASLKGDRTRSRSCSAGNRHTTTGTGNNTPEDDLQTTLCPELNRTGSLPKSHKICDPITLKWLESNFERKANFSVARSEMYRSYIQYCWQSGQSECTQAVFGKSVRAIFPSITTRRIGVRGQSKYHYCGIAAKPSSALYNKFQHLKRRSIRLPTTDTPTQMSEVKVVDDLVRGHSTCFKFATMLPDFPTIATAALPESLLDEAAEFLTLYRIYAEDILTAMEKADFLQMAQAVSSFWIRFPVRLASLMRSEDAQTLVFRCDQLLYRAVLDLVMPSVTEQQADGQVEVIRTIFEDMFPNLMTEALKFCPPVLKARKIRDVERFSRAMLNRLELFLQLNYIRVMLSDGETARTVHQEWSRLSVTHVISKASAVCDIDPLLLGNRIRQGVAEFGQLLANNRHLETYLTWLESLTTAYLQQDAEKLGVATQDRAGQVLLHFSYVTEILSQEMACLNSALAFHCFHRLETVLKDYVMHILSRNLDDVTRYSAHTEAGLPVVTDSNQSGDHPGIRQ